MQMVIITGGLGTRLGKEYKKTPKSMIKIAGKPFLAHQIELLRAGGLRKILLCIGHLGNQIKAHFGTGEGFGVEIRYSEEGEKLLGTGGALKKAEPLLEERFLLMWGDSYLMVDYQDIRQKFMETSCEGIMVVYRNDNRRVKSNVVVRNNRVALYDKWKSSPDMVYIDNGLSGFKKTLLNEIPSDTAYPLELIFKKWSEEGKLAAYITSQCFYEIGSLSGLREFETLVSNNYRQENTE